MINISAALCSDFPFEHRAARRVCTQHVERVPRCRQTEVRALRLEDVIPPKGASMRWALSPVGASTCTDTRSGLVILTLCIHPAGRQEREDLCTQEALLSPVQVTRTAHTRAKVVYADHPAEVKCAGRRARSAWVQCLFQQRNSWPFRPYRRHQSLRLLAGHVPCAHCARITSPSPANRAESVCFIYCCYQVGSQRRTANHAQMGQRRLLCNCAAAPRVEIGAASMPRAKTQHPPHLRH